MLPGGKPDPSAAFIPHAPVLDIFKPENFNPLATSHYVEALHNEAMAVDAAISTFEFEATHVPL
jgi:hypothetical protein